VQSRLCKGKYLHLVHTQMRAQAAHDAQHGRQASCQLWRAISSAFSLEADASDDARLSAFMEMGGFDGSKGKREMTPLMSASMAGNVELVRSLLDAGEDANGRYHGTAIGSLGIMRGATALHLAVIHGCSAACVELLLRRSANLDARAGPVGGNPLHAAAAVSGVGVRALAEGCAAAGVPLDVDAGALLNNASALNIAAYLGTPGSVAALLELGADVSHFNDNGGNVWSDVCFNPQMDIETLELIKSRAGIQHMKNQQRPLTARWAVISRVFEFLERAGRGESELVRELANSRGSTPLFWAASNGKLDLVRWLLENGAEPSVVVRNAQGRTPLQMAHLCGPHLAVEATLIGYQQGHSESRLSNVVRRGFLRDSSRSPRTGTSTRDSSRSARTGTSTRDSKRPELHVV
jgi:ankyrin repeat protein